MANGIYVAVSGSIARLEQLDVLAHDLANVKTPGFKRDQLTFESVRADAVAELGVEPDELRDKDFVVADDAHVRFEQGPLARTDSPLDVAIAGDGFLRVRTDRGERLTRNGRLMLGRDGLLRTTLGHRVMDAQGRDIALPPDRVPQIDADGLIRIEGHAVARLGVRAVADPFALRKDVDGLLTPSEDEPDQAIPPQPGEFEVMQGWIEQANTTAVTLMTELVSVQRNFEALHQVINTNAEMDRTAVQLAG